MATLHIEHPISDLTTWLTAFTKFAEARQKAGVRAQRIYQPVNAESSAVFCERGDTSGRADSSGR